MGHIADTPYLRRSVRRLTLLATSLCFLLAACSPEPPTCEPPVRQTKETKPPPRHEETAIAPKNVYVILDRSAGMSGFVRTDVTQSSTDKSKINNNPNYFHDVLSALPAVIKEAYPETTIHLSTIPTSLAKPEASTTALLSDWSSNSSCIAMNACAYNCPGTGRCMNETFFGGGESLGKLVAALWSRPYNDIPYLDTNDVAILISDLQPDTAKGGDQEASDIGKALISHLQVNRAVGLAYGLSRFNGWIFDLPTKVASGNPAPPLNTFVGNDGARNRLGTGHHGRQPFFIIYIGNVGALQILQTELKQRLTEIYTSTKIVHPFDADVLYHFGQGDRASCDVGFQPTAGVEKKPIRQTAPGEVAVPDIVTIPVALLADSSPTMATLGATEKSDANQQTSESDLRFDWEATKEPRLSIYESPLRSPFADPLSVEECLKRWQPLEGAENAITVVRDKKAPKIGFNAKVAASTFVPNPVYAYELPVKVADTRAFPLPSWHNDLNVARNDPVDPRIAKASSAQWPDVIGVGDLHTLLSQLQDAELGRRTTPCETSAVLTFRIE